MGRHGASVETEGWAVCRSEDRRGGRTMRERSSEAEGVTGKHGVTMYVDLVTSPCVLYDGVLEWSIERTIVRVDWSIG